MYTGTAVMPETISYSQVRTYCLCPMQWRLSRDYEPEFTPSALRFGGAVHEAVALFYGARKAGRTLALSDLVDTFEIAWTGPPDDPPVRFGRSETESAMKALARAMLSAFRAAKDREAADGGKAEVLAVEEGFRLVLDGMEAAVTGRIDLVERRDGTVWVVDHKTARSAPDESVDPDQLAIYAEAVAGMDLGGEPGKKISARGRGATPPLARCRLDAITKTARPQVLSVEVPMSPELVRVTLEKVRTIRRAMLEDIVYPVPGWQCAGCQWKSRCPLESA